MPISSALGSSALLPAGLGFRNVVINGGFDIWQRGTSASSAASGAAVYGADRWRFGANGAANQYTMTRVADTSPVAAPYAMRVTSANAGFGINGIDTVFEYANVSKLWGYQLTLSFYVRSSNAFSIVSSVDAGTLTNDVYPVPSNPLTGLTVLGSQTVNVTTSWQKVVIPCSALSTSMGQLRVYLANAFSFTNGHWIEFAGVQLEANMQPTPFEIRPVGVELALCQRYYEKSYDLDTAPGTNTNTGLYLISGSSDTNGNQFINILFGIPKRHNGYTMTFYLNSGGANSWSYVRNTVSGNVSMLATYSGTHSTGAYNANMGAAWVASYIYGHWTCSAEL